uniref:RED_N domain-containing protein n=1 Tax=Rhabditophanes sp. KR3021 TaxID=114890 RepID=A0AC35TSL5_9BILA
MRSNDDFRQLLTSKRTAAVPAVEHKGGDKNKDKDYNKANPEAPKSGDQKAKQKRPFKGKKVKGDEEFEGYGEQTKALNEIMSRYVDRAAERRKAEASDVGKAAIEKAQTQINQMNGPFSSDMPVLGRIEEIEKSKYLGGDLEHTHLVKGLDYSLLQKVKSKAEVEEELEDDALEKEFLEKKPESTSLFEIKSRLAKNIERIVMKNKYPLVNKAFRKGRMAFSFDLEDEDADIPTTVLRSVNDEDLSVNTMKKNIDKAVYTKLSIILANSKIDPKKRKKESEGDVEVKVQNIPMNMNIFDEEDGDYHYEKAASSSLNTSKGKNTNYFDEPMDECKEVVKEEIDMFGNIVEMATKVKVVSPPKASIQKRMLEIQGMGDDDAYSELYPSAAGFGESVLSDDDSEEEGGPKKKKKKGPEPEVSTKEGGNRKQRREAQAQERKLNSELTKINKIMDKRKDGKK